MTIETAQVGASGDDGYWSSGTGFQNAGVSDRIGQLGGTDIIYFARFDNLDFDGTIDSAKISLRAAANLTNSCPVTIHAELAADPNAPVSEADGNGRTLTVASVNWTPGNWTAGTYYDSPDIASVIQELADAYTYDGTQALIIYIVNNGSTVNRTVRSYDHDSVNSPAILEIDYTPSNTPPTISPNTADATTFNTTTPSLEFTGDDTEGDNLTYEIQISTDINFSADGIQLIDSFEGGGGLNIHPNPHATGTTIDGEVQVDDRPGQSIAPYGGILDSISVRLANDGPNPDGDALIRLYAHQGVYGTSSEPLNPADPTDTPTLNPLAVSDIISFTPTMSASATWYQFSFSGDERIRLVEGTKYVLILDWQPNNRNSDNVFACSGDSLNGGALHGGNVYVDGFAAPNNGPHATWDLHFRLYEDIETTGAASAIDPGFVNTVVGGDTDPFTEGQKIRYTVQSTLENGVSYYWRARAKDPAGSNIWSSYTSPRIFTINTSGGGGSDAKRSKTNVIVGIGI